MHRPPITRILVALLAPALLFTVTACGPDTTAPATAPVYPEFTTYPEIPVLSDLRYGDGDGTPLLLDACFPEEPEGFGSPASDPRPSVVVIHGGSWKHGDKSSLPWRSICQWFATEGYVAVSINYRLVPDAIFPAQLYDAQAAVDWLRDPAQVARFNLDPARIGAFGGSAGGNLAALLGTAGSGSWAEGSRVAAVADLSGPVDLRRRIPTGDGYTQDFGQVVLDYVGCADFTRCPSAAAASPVTRIDPTDPPFLVAHSTDEFIPVSQARDFVAGLQTHAIDTTYVEVPGTAHAAELFDDAMKASVLAFFDRTLARPAAGFVPEPAPTAGPVTPPTS